jgi:hypothetical protein
LGFGAAALSRFASDFDFTGGFHYELIGTFAA